MRYERISTLFPALALVHSCMSTASPYYPCPACAAGHQLVFDGKGNMINIPPLEDKRVLFPCPACENGDCSFCGCTKHPARAHTCVSTQLTSDGSILPPCAACQENFKLGYTRNGPPPSEFDWRQAAKDLWTLLDDIDTLGDAMHPEHTSYFTRVNLIAEKRHRILHSDGHELKSWPPPPPEKKD